MATDNTLLCDCKFVHAILIAMHVVLRNIFSRFSRNSEAKASEFVENLEEMSYKIPVFKLLFQIILTYNSLKGHFMKRLTSEEFIIKLRIKVTIFV